MNQINTSYHRNVFAFDNSVNYCFQSTLCFNHLINQSVLHGRFIFLHVVFNFLSSTTQLDSYLLKLYLARTSVAPNEIKTWFDIYNRNFDTLFLYNFRKLLLQ